MPSPTSERARGLPAYAVILLLVLISVVNLVVTFGDDLRQLFDNSGANAPVSVNAAASPPSSLKDSGAGAGATGG